MYTDTFPLYVIPDGVEARWINAENPHGEKGRGGQANGGRKGSPCYGPLAAGECKVLADYSGSSGIIKHIWTTIDKRSPQILRGLRVDITWDGAATPAISVPYGDFFGSSLGLMPAYTCAFFSNPEGRNFNCHIPMPFQRGCKITVTNETETDLDMFWFHADMTINNSLPEPMYLHAAFQRQRTTMLQQDYEFLPLITGKGRYLGTNFGVQANTGEYLHSWWGEGEVKIYLDGDTDFPTLCGTGTEDYICTSWGQGQYANPYYGCPVADENALRYCFYRYHVTDPIYFHREIRAAIQQIGCWDPPAISQMHQAGRQLLSNGIPALPIDMAAAADANGYCLFEREGDDWSSCAYLYLDRATNSFPPLQPLAERIAELPE